MREDRHNPVQLTKVTLNGTSTGSLGNYNNSTLHLDNNGTCLSAGDNKLGHYNDKVKDGVEDSTNIEKKKDAEKTSGCCGRDKSKKATHAVGVFELFKYSTKIDKTLILIGTLGALGAGVIIPLNIENYGEVIDVFVDTSAVSGNASAQHKVKINEKILPQIYWFIAIGIGCFICNFFAVSCWQLAAERQVNTIRKKFFFAVMRQDISWFDVHEAGEISSRFSEDVNKLAEGMGDKMAVFLQWMTIWLASYIMAFTHSWKLTLAIIVFSPIMICIGSVISKITRRLAAEEAEDYARAGAVAEQALRSIRTVQAFQGQEKEITRYKMNLNDTVLVASKKGLVLGLGNSAVWVFLYLTLATALWFGMFLIQDERLTAGKVLPVFLGAMIGSMSLGYAFATLECFSNARGAATKVFDTIALQSKIDVFSSEGKKPASLIGHIEFRNVQFSYPARSDVQILKDLTLSIEPGQNVALVGPSGCGKSTTVQLLQRFYDPLAGQVLVDGHNIKDLNLRWLREQIGVVSQEPVLFDASIEENIRFGKLDATEMEIHQAAKDANAHDFIKALPSGYKTNVGERGAQLSGGQKQRISIARALVRNPKILLLDEATSALDHESEAMVQNALENAGKGRTTITIAHRLSTIRHADNIVAISDGMVVEQGTHDQLVAEGGLYHQLVEIQTRISKDSSMNLSDVEIVEEDEAEEDKFDEEELIRTTYKRKVSQVSSKSAEKEFRMIARPSLGNINKKEAKGKNDQDGASPDEVDDIKLSEIFRYNAPEWPMIVLGCLGSVICGGIHPSFAYILSEFVRLFGIKDPNEQWMLAHILAGSIVGVAVVSAVVRMLQCYCFSRSGAYLTARLRKLTFASMINQDMEFFDLPNNQVGALTAQLAGDAAMVQGATGSKVGQVLEALSCFVSAIGVAFANGWKLTLVVLSFMPLMIGAGIIQGRVQAGAAKKDRAQLQQAGRICSEVVDGIGTVVSLSREDHFINKFNQLIDITKTSNKKMSLVFGVTFGFANCLVFFSYAVTFYYGSVLVADGEMEFYEVFQVFGAIIFGGMMIGRQSSFGVDYTKAKLAAARTIALINRKPKIDVREDSGLTMAEFRGSISVSKVMFKYPTRPKTTVLDDMNLVINPGETVALVGASGCGKSTTTQLIERFYDTHAGAMLADGQDIKKLNLKWYRRQLGIVSQEPTLFDCSIAENIAYGDTARVVPMVEIIQAAKDANIHNFISQLPQGYDTNVGDKGAQLSGGQKQRIAIARALVRNPKILLLDEATSALDTDSEKIVQEALDKVSKNRTCVTIAHRLSTIQNADKIAVVSKGKVVEIGNHSQLVAIKGAYYRLLQAQNRPHKNHSS